MTIQELVKKYKDLSVVGVYRDTVELMIANIPEVSDVLDDKTLLTRQQYVCKVPGHLLVGRKVVRVTMAYSVWNNTEWVGTSNTMDEIAPAAWTPAVSREEFDTLKGIVKEVVSELSEIADDANGRARFRTLEEELS